MFQRFAALLLLAASLIGPALATVFTALLLSQTPSHFGQAAA